MKAWESYWGAAAFLRSSTGYPGKECINSKSKSAALPDGRTSFNSSGSWLLLQLQNERFIICILRICYLYPNAFTWKIFSTKAWENNKNSFPSFQNLRKILLIERQSWPSKRLRWREDKQQDVQWNWLKGRKMTQRLPWVCGMENIRVCFALSVFLPAFLQASHPVPSSKYKPCNFLTRGLSNSFFTSGSPTSNIVMTSNEIPAAGRHK